MRALFSLIALIFLLSGCAIGQKTNYLGDLSVKLPETENKYQVVVAVQDIRPRTLEGTDSPSRVGTLRSIAGVPWPIKTSSGAPLANDLGESLNRKFISEGYNSYAIPTLPTDNEEVVRDKAFSHASGARLLHFKLHTWETENWFTSRLIYCVELVASTKDRACNARAKLCDEKTLPSDTPGYDDLFTAVGTIFSTLLADPAIVGCRIPGNSPEKKSPVKPKARLPQKCTTQRILNLSNAGISKEDIEEECGK